MPTTYRRRRHLVWWMSLLSAVALLTVSFAGGLALAKSPPPVYQWALASQNLNLASSTQELTPASNIYAFYFDVPSGIAINGATIHLFFRYSPVLIGSESTLIMAVDGIPYATSRLWPRNSANASLSVTVPAKDLRPGYHALTITVQLRSQRNICNDYDSLQNWLVVLPASYIHFNPSNDGPLPDLARFPFPFVQPFQAATYWHNRIIVPQNASNTTLTAAFVAVDSLAHNAPAAASAQAQVTTIPVDSVPQSHGLFLYVARWDHIPLAWKKQMQVNWNGHAGEGLLDEIALNPKRGPANSDMVLVVTGQTGAAVIQAANALNQPKLMAELPGSSAWISTAMLKAAAHAGPSTVIGTTPLREVVNLAELGYSQTLMSGKEEEVAVFSLTTPLTWHYGPNAGFHLILRNSSLLTSTSAVIVSVNNQPMASHTLSAATATGVDLFVPFPKGIRPGQTVAVSVQAEMFLPHPTCMGTPNDLRSFVSISPQSWFGLPHIDQPSLALTSFPSLFVTNEDRLRTVTAVLPAHPTSAQLTALARVMAGYADIYQGSVQVQTKRPGPLPIGNLWLVGITPPTMPVTVRSDHLASRRLPVSSEAATDGAVVEQTYRPDRPGAIWLIAATNSQDLVNLATWFAANRPPYQADGAVLIRVQGRQNSLLNFASSPFESWAAKLGQSLEQAYLFLFEQSGQTLLYLIAFIASLGSVLSYLLWSFFRRRPDLRERIFGRRAKKG